MKTMTDPLKLALLAVFIVGCGCRAETQNIETVHTKLVKLENWLIECLTDIKAQIHELQYNAFYLEEPQPEQIQNKPTDQLMCPCSNEPITRDETEGQNSFISCQTLKTGGNPSGRYMITVSNTTFEVYCEQNLNGGGWTVIQNRYDGSVDFNRNWASYRNGFGDLSGEFWIGLEKIYKLTSSREHELMVHMEDFSGHTGQARYSRFAISDESDQYKLIAIEYASGTSGLSRHYGRKFSTYDRDNDADANRNCAQLGKSGWWHQCYEWSNLNGMYQNGLNSGDGNYSPLMTWGQFKEYNGLKKSKMMIREV